MVRIKRELAARGAHAEGVFRAWLDASRLPYVYATQDRESVPAHFRANMKRPDYLVALPYVAAVAFDVKSKSVYDGDFLFDVSEVRRLTHFGELFAVATFFACLDPEGSPDSVWFRASELLACPVRKLKGRPVFVVPFAQGVRLSIERPFQDALRDAITLR